MYKIEIRTDAFFIQMKMGANERKNILKNTKYYLNRFILMRIKTGGFVTTFTTSLSLSFFIFTIDTLIAITTCDEVLIVFVVV